MNDRERSALGASAGSRQVVASLLDRVRRRWTAVVWLRAGCRAALGAAGVLGLVALADRLGAPVDLVLVSLAVGGVLLAVTVAARLLWPARRSPSDGQVARYIEEHYPELEDRLVSASDRRTGEGDAGAFGTLVLAEAARRARDIDPTAIVRSTALRGATVRMLGAAACLVGALLVARDPAGRALQVVWLHLFPDAFSVEVEPGNTRVVVGDSLQVRATFRGGPGTSGGTVPRLVVDDGVETRAVEMVLDDDAFVYEIAAVASDFTYRVDVATASSPAYRVVALFPPTIERIDVHYDYPAFTGLGSRAEEDAGDVYAPAGTAVRMTVHVDKPIDMAEMVMADGERVELTVTTEGALEGELDIERDGSYRIALVDTDGLRNADSTEYFIRVMDDRPPEVRILRPGGDRDITPLEEVTIEARADDDYGVDRFELVYSVRGGPERTVSLTRTRGAATVSGRHLLFTEDLAVEPGDFITYYARARDVSRAKRSTESRSDIFFLQVKPFEEEFVAAQSQSMMGGGGGGSLDELVAAQKAVIVATWKLERRSTGGRSPDDIRAVGRAQGELKERTAAAAAEAAGARGGRRLAAPEVAGDEESPLQMAVVAMGQAEAALGQLQTEAALPGEMEALNHLLKAEAEIRRRQVARQAAGGGGGGASGAQQDLSALFDRELQRRQETNYETPNSGSQRTNEPASEALRRVRELARRQDELSRQQRELARQRAGMTEEELKRRLERLTREQSELREQAEELDRQLARERATQDGQAGEQQDGQQAQAGQQRGQRPGEAQSGGGSAGAGQMRGISEEMQRAASELRRDDPGEASRRADQALAGLRELERELAGGQPAQQRRALGELQLESQQVAEAQRRIAREARQLDPRSPNASAVRRLAEQREELADRVDDLGQRLGELGRNMSAEQGDALSDAADTLDREEVSDRMRAAAASLREIETAMAQRDAAPASEGRDAGARTQPDSAETERLARADEELTRTLDGVARQLGESAGEQDLERRQLSEQLAKSNELRERLRALQERLAQLGAAGDQRAASGGQPTGTPGSETGESPGEQTEGTAAADGAAGTPGDAAGLEQAYREELSQTLEMMEQLQDETSQLGGGRGTPERQQLSVSAPGTEAFKQDYAAWDALRRDVTLALEQLEQSLTRRLSEKETEDRLNADADQRMPDDYRNLVSKYYQALAAKKRN